MLAPVSALGDGGIPLLYCLSPYCVKPYGVACVSSCRAWVARMIPSGHNGVMSTVTRLPEPSSSKGRLGAEIRARLARYGLTQTELGETLGLSQGQVSKRLRGTVAFNIDELDVVAEFFETTVIELLGGTPPTGPNGGQAGRSRGVVTREYSHLRLVA